MSIPVLTARRPLARRVESALLLAFLVAGQFAVALLAASDPKQAVQVIGFVGAAAALLVFPRFLLIAALVATLYPTRVGPASFDMSLTDAVGFLALIAALRFRPWRDPRVRIALIGLVVYLGFVLITLVPHHSSRALFEFFHRGTLFGGSILIGAAIVASGSTRWALRCYTIGAAALSLVAIQDAFQSGFEPSYPLEVHKNAAGVCLAIAFLVLLLARRHLAWPTWWIGSLMVITLAGLAATQSRASAAGLIAALAARPLFMGKRGTARRGAILVLGACVVIGTLSMFSFQETELSRTESEQKFGSVETRIDAFDETINNVWGPSKLTGGGMRYWNDPANRVPTPHNIVVGELGEAGLLGLAGLIVLVVATVIALRRGRGDLAVLGFCALITRLVQGFADIFWVAGPLTAAMIMVGIGLADDPEHDDGAVADDAPASDATSPVDTMDALAASAGRAPAPPRKGLGSE